MTIGFDGSRAFVKDRTGTENYSYQLLKHLTKFDTENIFKVYIRSGCEVGHGWPKNFQFITINLPRLWTQVGLAFRTFIDKLDILFTPAHTIPLIRKPGLKTVMTIHDLGSEYLPWMHQIKQKLYLDFITKFQLNSATKLIAVSKATKNDLVDKAKVDKEKVEVIYEGVDQKVFKPVKTDLLDSIMKTYDIKKNSYFVFVGTIQPRKNLIRLIEAFKNVTLSEAKGIYSSPSAQNDKFKLVLVGSKGWLSEEIYALPKKLGIEEKVNFLGHVDDKDLPALYTGAIALVFPSLFEGFGLPILEAFSCGCPVITSNISSMPEITGDAAILVDPYNQEEITDAMTKLVTNNSLRDDLIKQGFKQVEGFSWEKSAQQTLKLFKRL